MFKTKLLTITLAALGGAAFAQSPHSVPSRITGQVDTGKRVTVGRSVHPLARPEFDQGQAPSSLPLERMVLVLKRSPEQQAALDQLISDQQNKSSAQYQQWLTPAQFGERFGPANADVQKITDWLQSQGFYGIEVAKGKSSIQFSGDAIAVSHAFATEIHEYAVNGKRHWANSRNPQIPAALAPVVAGIASLNNFQARPLIHLTGTTLNAQAVPGTLKPRVTFSSSSHGLAPSDLATIYNVNPVYQRGINGSGATIAVLGRSNINTQDVADFRRVFALPASNPQIIVNGNDPGNLGGGDEAEAVLDVSWAGALAPSAAVDFIVSQSTNSSDGVFLSEQYAVDNNIGDVISESFGTCEADISSAAAQAISSLAQQAAAQGQTYVVATDDSGSAGCDNPNTESSASGPVSVNVLASTPYTIAVGGTVFNEAGNSSYWSSGNGTGWESAQSYIPQNVWNDSCSGGACGNASIWAGGGGASIYYGKPSWQTGVTGIPNDGKRDVPDVAFAAAGSNDPYLLCLRGSCSSSSGSVSFAGVGGTSAAAPAFAGIMALARQATGSRQGQANVVLYSLAASQNWSACDGSNTSSLPSSNCLFNDITYGTNAVPGEYGYNSSSEQYTAGTGYDLASGLGSPNVGNLIARWTGANTTAASTPTTYELVNKGSGLALDVQSEAGYQGAQFIQNTYYGGSSQKWTLVPTAAGYYRLQNQKSGEIMAVAGMSAYQGAAIIQWPWTQGPDQQWQVVQVDSTYYKLVDGYSGMVAAVASNSVYAGTVLIQWPYTGVPSELWQLVPVQ